MPWYIRMWYRAAWLRSLERQANERARVEQDLYQCANGKAPLPDRQQCREWARRLGVLPAHRASGR